MMMGGPWVRVPASPPAVAASSLAAQALQAASGRGQMVHPPTLWACSAGAGMASQASRQASRQALAHEAVEDLASAAHRQASEAEHLPLTGGTFRCTHTTQRRQMAQLSNQFGSQRTASGAGLRCAVCMYVWRLCGVQGAIGDYRFFCCCLFLRAAAASSSSSSSSACSTMRRSLEPRYAA